MEGQRPTLAFIWLYVACVQSSTAAAPAASPAAAPSAAPPPNNPCTCDSRLGEVVESRQVYYLLLARLRSSTFPDTHACVYFPPTRFVSSTASVVMYQKKEHLLADRGRNDGSPRARGHVKRHIPDSAVDKSTLLYARDRRRDWHFDLAGKYGDGA